MDYLEIIPSELKHVIGIYLDYEDVIKLNGINWEFLFSLKFPIIYKYIKQVFNRDIHIRKYANSYEIIYSDINNYGKNVSSVTAYFLSNVKMGCFGLSSVYIMSSITVNILNRVIILKKYPNSYHLLKKLDNIVSGDINSVVLASLMVRRIDKITKDFFKTGELKKVIKFEDILGYTHYDTMDKLIHIILLLDEPNFKFSKSEDINEILDLIDIIRYEHNRLSESFSSYAYCLKEYILKKYR